MTQAIHGGRLRDAAREFGRPADSFLDFSSNINALTPAMALPDWDSLRAAMRRYPEADANGVRERLAAIYQASVEQIIPTAGAIEALYLAARLFHNCNPAIIEPAFSDYSRAFEAAGHSPARLPLPRGLWHAPAVEWAHLLEPFDVIVLGNPNNPTGAFQSREVLRRLMEKSWDRPKTWIVDEAFIEFVEDHERASLLPLLDAYPSLILLRSLTKSWAIPGLRLGFLAASNQHWLTRLRQMQPPWSINSIAEEWSATHLTRENHTRLRASLRDLHEEKQRFAAGIGAINGIRVFPSACNFLLVEYAGTAPDAHSVYRELGRRGLLVRVCDSFHGIPPGRFIRVAVRTASENNRLIEELATACAGVIEEAA